MKHLWSINPIQLIIRSCYVKDPYSSNRKATISSKLHCAPNSRLTYYSDSRMYQVCPVVEFWSRCSLLIMHGAVSPNLEGKNKASMFNYLWTNICCYHRTELSTYSLFLKPKTQCTEKKTYLNFQIPLFPGKQFCKICVCDLQNRLVRALLRLVTMGKLFSTTTVKGSIYTICRVWHKNGRGGGGQNR